MTLGNDYLQEIQKFTSSQYWYSGWRITAGVAVPLFVFILTGWLSSSVPFLWGALFVSLTDTPGPIHHRRNGMIAAVLLNTLVVLLTTFTKDHQILVIGQVVVFGFFLTMLGVYGGRAGAVGTLALILMLLNLLSLHQEYNTIQGVVLVAAGGTWYTIFSLLLHGIRPYRPVEQALGEHLMAIADYTRARASFYREGVDISQSFDRVMRRQSDVKNIQDQTQELLFKTRRIVSDASPRSRSLMMIYLDSLDLLEEAMSSYRDYEDLHKTLRDSGLLNHYYGLILQLAAGIEYVGMTIQRGSAVKKDFDFTRRVNEVKQQTNIYLQTNREAGRLAHTLDKILSNIQAISNLMNRLAMYTRMEGDVNPVDRAQRVSRMAATQPVSVRLLLQNMTFKSETFTHAIRLTIAMIAGYLVSVSLSLAHSYWVLLTIVTIMRPAYVLTRKRNIERVAGTLVGVVLVIAILWFVSDATVLLVILILSMLLGYSMLRVQYFVFVVFLTIFLIISLYFLNPLEFQSLIRERLLDTILGSVIAFLASRFIFPVWGHREITGSMQKMLEANRQYFSQAWMALQSGESHTHAYVVARQDAIVSLTNLSENFQRMLAEPQQTRQATPIHQFVIANHMLTGYIAALSDEQISGSDGQELEEMAKAITYELQCAEDNLRHTHSRTDLTPAEEAPLPVQSPGQVSTIYALARDIRKIAARVGI